MTREWLTLPSGARYRIDRDHLGVWYAYRDDNVLLLRSHDLRVVQDYLETFGDVIEQSDERHG
jgi:hypothetical protein